jgi:peptidoglycan/LPS O-acetylase OafA/YrhL
LGNWVQIARGPWPVLGPTWSLAVEEHFYLLLAGFTAWRFRPGRPTPTLRAAVVSFCMAASLVLLTRVLTTVSILGDPARGRIELHYFATHLRIDALLFGVLLSFIYHYRPDVWARLTAPRRRLAATSALLLAPALFFPGPHPFTVTIGYTLYYLAFGILLALVLPRPGERTSPATAGRVERALAAVGAYSYSIYLWHTASKHWSAPVWKAVVGQELGYVGQAVLYFVSSLVLGVLMARLVELPFLRIRDLAFPSRSSPAAAPLAYPPGTLAGTSRHPVAASEIPFSLDDPGERARPIAHGPEQGPRAL